MKMTATIRVLGVDFTGATIEYLGHSHDVVHKQFHLTLGIKTQDDDERWVDVPGVEKNFLIMDEEADDGQKDYTNHILPALTGQASLVAKIRAFVKVRLTTASGIIDLDADQD